MIDIILNHFPAIEMCASAKKGIEVKTNRHRYDALTSTILPCFLNPSGSYSLSQLSLAMA